MYLGLCYMFTQSLRRNLVYSSSPWGSSNSLEEVEKEGEEEGEEKGVGVVEEEGE